MFLVQSQLAGWQRLSPPSNPFAFFPNQPAFLLSQRFEGNQPELFGLLDKIEDLFLVADAF